VATGKPVPPFSMRIQQAGDTLVVRASGALDASQAKTFEVELREALTGEASAVLLDLSELEFIDSTGLRTLMIAAEEAGSDGDKLRVRRSLSPAVERLLDLTGLADRLPWVLST
jgi:anti-anti-sigma factor